MKRVLVVFAAACTSVSANPTTAGSGSSSKEAPAAQFEHDMMVRFHMHENFGLLRAIEKLLLRGKLDEARDLARAIAVAPDEPGANAWSAQATRVRDQAGALAGAKTVEEACFAEAKLAHECASCHVASGAMPEFASPPKMPPDRPSIDARMVRHLWASERLWEGMVGMADDSWAAGLDVLAVTPLPASELGADRQPYARKLQQLAETARKMKNVDQDRTKIYGEMLATCAACHTVRRSK
ncbi:MAG: hypothetical protein JWO36_5979 [Myxococcales bacterium]|nr:hypothetical protein [Myxococcales bacterium]